MSIEATNYIYYNLLDHKALVDFPQELISIVTEYAFEPPYPFSRGSFSVLEQDQCPKETLLFLNYSSKESPSWEHPFFNLSICSGKTSSEETTQCQLRLECPSYHLYSVPMDKILKFFKDYGIELSLYRDDSIPKRTYLCCTKKKEAEIIIDLLEKYNDIVDKTMAELKSLVTTHLDE